MQSPEQPSDWVAAPEAAAELGVTEGYFAKLCREGRFLSSRKEDPAREKSPWLVTRVELARRIEIRDHKRRVRESGIVAAYDDDEFDAKVEQRHGRATMEQVRAIRERGELLAQMAREVRADADLHREFEQLDEDQAIEATARAIAGRVRREERIQRRAAQILAADDDDDAA